MTFTDKPNGLQENLDEESLLHRMIKQIRRSLDLPEIITTNVNEVRTFLNTDRVSVNKISTNNYPSFPLNYGKKPKKDKHQNGNQKIFH